MISPVKSIEVTLADGVTKETVQIKRLTLRQLFTYIETLGGKSSPEVVALCAGKPLEWVDTLSDESFGELSQITFTENFTRAVALSKVDSPMAAALAPFVGKMLQASGVAGGVKLPSSPSQESAEATPSAS